MHPQHWPEDLDYAGKRVVVIGSGATAVTLVPAMAGGEGAAARVTMLQRSPTYVLALPGIDRIAVKLRERLSPRTAYAVTRWKNVLVTTASYQLSRRRPELMKKLIRKGVTSQLPEGYDVDTHFKPAYDPWDQRLCLVPDGDLFRSIRHGTVDVVTDHIDRFTPHGIRLRSGDELEADVIVTATGLNLLAFGGLELDVDGDAVHLPDTMAYKGMLLSGVPNFAYVIGYTNASWTLKADLVSEYVCRLLAHMRSRRYDVVVAEKDPAVEEEPFMDFASGYVQRSLHLLPKQGSRAPWRLRMNYLRDVLTIRRGAIEDDALRFSRARDTGAPYGVTGPIAQTPEPPYVAVIFTSLRTEGDRGYAAMSARMDELAAEQPGYLGIEAARDGLGITVSYWADEEAAAAWKQVAAHLVAQQLGRETWYSDYRVRVAVVHRDYGPTR